MNQTRLNCQFLAFLLVALALASCQNTDVAKQQERVVSVNAVVVQLSNEEVVRDFTGSLEGEKQADIYAKIAEAVERVRVREGAAVYEGQVLISLDKTGPSSMYRTTESIFKNAEKNFQKMDYLYKEGAVSESQFDAARTEYEVARVSFESASRLVEIQSPISGVVTSLEVSDGDYLNIGQKLATIASVDKLRVRFGVNSRDVGFIKERAKVTVSADEVYRTVEGEVVSVARSADPQTRSFQVEVLFDNTESLYRPGMFVRVGIVLNVLTGVIVVPRDAVLTLDDKQCAFVVSGGVVHKRVVSLGVELNGKVVITDGLAVGDTLVTLGQNYLDEGFKVKIVRMETIAQ